MRTEQPVVAPLWFRACLAFLTCGAGLYLLREQLPFGRLLSGQASNPQRRCETSVNDRLLSDTVVKQLKAVPLNSSRVAVEALLGPPYCQLPLVHVRAKVESERFLYRQAGDPSWLVVLYEGVLFGGVAFDSQPPQRGK